MNINDINLEEIELVPTAKASVSRNMGTWVRIKDSGMISGSQAAREAYGLDPVHDTHAYLYVVRVDGGYLLGIKGTPDDSTARTCRVTYNSDPKTGKIAGFSIRAKAFLASAKLELVKDLEVEFVASEMLEKQGVKLLLLSNETLEGHIAETADNA